MNPIGVFLDFCVLRMIDPCEERYVSFVNRSQKGLLQNRKFCKQCRKLGGERVKGAGFVAPFTFNNPPAGDGSCRKQFCFLYDPKGLLHFATAPFDCAQTRETDSAGRKIVTKETRDGCLSFSITKFSKLAQTGEKTFSTV